MKGLTKLLREMGAGEVVTVTDTVRDNIYAIARRVGIKVQVEKFVGGFYVTRVSQEVVPPVITPTPSPFQGTEDAIKQEKLTALRAMIGGSVPNVSYIPAPVEDEWAGWSEEREQYDQVSGETVYYREHLKTRKRKEIRRETYYG